MAIQQQNSPYFDDYNDEKLFQKLLFRPRRAIQTRELNQLQTILQKQVSRFGDHVFANGSMVIPGNIDVDFNLDFIKINITPSTYSNVGLTNLDDVVGRTISAISGGSEGLTALIVNFTPVEGADAATLFVRYLSSGGAGSDISKFQPGEQIAIDLETIGTVKTLIQDATPTGKGSAVSINAGVYYAGGYFLKVLDGNIVVSKYTTNPSSRVGLQYTESVVGFVDDSSILDNAFGSPNSGAPGADRLKIELVLAKKDYFDVTVDDKFFDIVKIFNGTVQKKVRFADYAVLEETLARRFYDSEGDFILDPFEIDIREHLNDEVGNRGVYTSAQGGDATKLAIGLDAGKAYVRGYEIITDGKQFVPLNKARTTKQINNGPLNFAIGSFAKITDVYTIPNITDFETVYLYSSTAARGGDPGGGALVGTAKVRAIQLDTAVNVDGTAAELDPASIWNLYLFDIVMNANKTFSNDVKFLRIPDTQIFTAKTVLDVDNQAQIYASPNVGNVESIGSLFKYPKRFISTIRGPAGPSDIDTNYYARRQYSATVSSGSISFGPLTGGEVFSSYNNRDYVLTVTDNGSGSANLGDVINLDGATVALSSGSTVLTISNIAAYNGNIVRLHATIFKPVAQEKTKTLTVATALTGVTPASQILLGKADIYELTSVVSSVDGDVSSRYALDDGQRDDFYDIGRINLTSGQTLPTGTLTINFKYFSHGSGDYFSVDSYNTQVDYEDIPIYTASTGKQFPLRDCLDFRPRVKDAYVGTGDNVFTGTGSSMVEFIKPDSDIRADYQYYVGRVDKVYVGRNGDFGIVYGIPADNPIPPKDPTNVVVLYVLGVPPYTLTPQSISITTKQNKRYTSNDIAILEKRIGNIEYATALSNIEQKTKEIITYDGNGDVRFKSGFFAEGFRDLTIGNSNSLDFDCSIDTRRGILFPEQYTTAVKMILDAANSTGYNTGAATNGKILTLAVDSEVLAAEQPYASSFINVNPFDVYLFNGFVKLSPPTDSWFETQYEPDIFKTTIINDDAASLFDTLNNFNGWPRNTWMGTEANIDRNWTDGQIRLDVDFGGHNTWRTIFSETEFDKKVDEKIVDSSVQFFMRGVEIGFDAKGLKPLSRVYPFFDGVEVSAITKPTGGAYGDELITNSSGTISGTLKIPGADAINTLSYVDAGDRAYIRANAKFKTGKREFLLTDSSTGDPAEATTKAKEIFVADGAIQTKQKTITSVRQFVVTTGTHFVDPLAQSFLLERNGGSFVTKIKVYFKSKDANIPVTLQIREMENGIPTTRILPGASKTLLPASVSISNNGTTGTDFVFDYPIYLENNIEYCFFLAADSNQYNIFIGESAKTDFNGTLINKNPYIGVLFKSQNSSTWSEEQNQDIKFQIYVAQFASSGSVRLIQESIPTGTGSGGDTLASLVAYLASDSNYSPFVTMLDPSPFQTTNSTNTVIVFHKNHGLNTNDKVLFGFRGTVPANINGIPTSQFTAAFLNVTFIDLDRYSVATASNATGTGRTGGSNVFGTCNIKMDKVFFSSTQLSHPETSVGYVLNATKANALYASNHVYTVSGAVSLLPENDIDFTDSQVVLSGPNAQYKPSANPSAYLTVAITSSNPNVSPVVDLERACIVAASNRINYNTASTPLVFDETVGIDSNSTDKYVSKPIILEVPSKSIRVFVSAVRPTDSDIKLYAKVDVDGSGAFFDYIPYFEVPAIKYPGASTNLNEAKEYEFMIDDLDLFNKYQLKLVARAINTAQPPRVYDIRCITLAT